jgi:predicted porin
MRRKLLAVAITGVLAAPTGVEAGEVEFSGQVNRAIVYMGDGEGTGVQFVDNDTSGTRFRVRGSQDIGRGIKAGFYGEWQSSNNPSDDATVKGNNSENPGFRSRQANVWFSGKWGEVTLGQTDGAGNKATEVDLSGTRTVAKTPRSDFGGGVAWRTSGGGCIAKNGTTLEPDCPGIQSSGGGDLLTHGRTTDNFDALSRYDVLRYDSPAFGPLALAASVGADEQWEAAARISTALMGGDLSGALFFADATNARGFKNYGGSASYLFGNGLNLTASYSRQDFDAGGKSTATNWWTKVGYRWGNNAVSIDYGQTEDFVDDYTDSGVRFGYNYQLPKPKIDLYAGAQWSQLDTPGGVSSVQNIWTVMSGSRIKF